MPAFLKWALPAMLLGFLLPFSAAADGEGPLPPLPKPTEAERAAPPTLGAKRQRRRVVRRKRARRVVRRRQTTGNAAAAAFVGAQVDTLAPHLRPWPPTEQP